MSSSHTNAAAPPVFRSFLFSPPRGVQRQRHPTTTAKRHSIRKHLEAVFGTRIVVGAQFNGYIPAMSTLQLWTTTTDDNRGKKQSQSTDTEAKQIRNILNPCSRPLGWDGA